MSAYIYTLYEKADPSRGWIMNDPIFEGSRPTLGACVPNLRSAVRQGDWIFAVSGRMKGEKQFVVGGFKVVEKIDQLAAYDRFPENRLRRAENGQLVGNVIVDANGEQHPEDTHDNFANRIKNYLVGGEPVFLTEPKAFEIAKEETLPVLSRILGKEGARVFDLIGRQRKLTDEQSEELRSWLESVRSRGM
jgi:hypothetical protein